MVKTEDFNLRISGLKNGSHQFNFRLEKEFFELFESELIKDGDVNIVIDMEKDLNGFTLHFNVSGFIEQKCDRCLNPVSCPIFVEETIVYKQTEVTEINEVDEHLVMLPMELYEYNIAQTMYELVSIQKPIKVVCEDYNNACDGKTIDYLENSMAQEEESDPRWAALNKLKNNLN